MANPSDIFNETPGLVSPSTYAIIAKIVTLLGPNPRVLEIGSFLGKSTVAWMDHLPEGSVLNSLDWHYNDRSALHHTYHITRQLVPNREYLNKEYNHFFNWLYPSNNQQDAKTQLQAWQYCVGRHPNAHMIEQVYTMKSKEYVEKDLGKNYDCVFVDGDHSYEAVSMELEYFKDVPIICGDDFFMDSVVSAVTEHRDKYNKKMGLYQAGNFWVLR